MHFGGAGIEFPEDIPSGATGVPGLRRCSMEGAMAFPGAATVFSAWCWAIHDLMGTAALEEMLAQFAGGCTTVFACRPRSVAPPYPAPSTCLVSSFAKP